MPQLDQALGVLQPSKTAPDAGGLRGLIYFVAALGSAEFGLGIFWFAVYLLDVAGFSTAQSDTVGVVLSALAFVVALLAHFWYYRRHNHPRVE